MKKILLVFGTRPEAIKMAPLIKELQKYPEQVKTIVCTTGQHKQMLEQVLKLFEIEADYDLSIMKQGQDLYDVTSKVLLGLRDILKEVAPDIVLVHGDTTTSTAAALATFYQQIPIGHIEAGLRTYDALNPFPEEMNRQLTARLASLHFSPTENSKNNLLQEAIPAENIFITGNTGIDSLHWVCNKFENDTFLTTDIKKELLGAGYDISRLKDGKKMVLITGHRRENFGEGFINMCKAIKTLTEKYPEIDFIYPMHLNPNVRNAIKTVFNEEQTVKNNMFFIEPLEYFTFILLMQHSYLILTDSGGIQEEAPGLGKPVLVRRETTERPEAVTAGTVKLVGTDYKKIIDETSLLIDSPIEYKKMSKAINPYGDGKACSRIVEILKEKR